MTSKLLLSFWALSLAPSIFAWVHISELKPRLPVSPSQPNIIFHWNGDAPELDDKDEVFAGKYSQASNSELMEALLDAAVATWNAVETTYIKMQITTDSSAQMDENDEIFSIVVAEQESVAVAAAAQPSFISQDPNPSANESNPHIIHDCDISVSTAKVSAKSLLRTLVHELGHCLGLGHPHASYASIMSYASSSQGSSLALDDKAAVSFLYPRPGQSQKVQYLTTCGSLGSDASAAGWAGILTLVPVLSLGLRLLFRRFRSNRNF